MIKLEEFECDRPYGPWLSRGCDVWDAMSAATYGDARALGRLLECDPKLSEYDQHLYIAVREGHLDAARVLLDAGADSGEELLTIPRNREKDRRTHGGNHTNGRNRLRSNPVPRDLHSTRNHGEEPPARLRGSTRTHWLPGTKVLIRHVPL